MSKKQFFDRVIFTSLLIKGKKSIHLVRKIKYLNKLLVNQKLIKQAILLYTNLILLHNSNNIPYLFTKLEQINPSLV